MCTYVEQPQSGINDYDDDDVPSHNVIRCNMLLPSGGMVTLLVQGNNVNTCFLFTPVQLTTTADQSLNGYMVASREDTGIALDGNVPYVGSWERNETSMNLRCNGVSVSMVRTTVSLTTAECLTALINCLDYVFDCWLIFKDQERICMITLSQVESHYLCHKGHFCKPLVCVLLVWTPKAGKPCSGKYGEVYICQFGVFW